MKSLIKLLVLVLFISCCKDKKVTRYLDGKLGQVKSRGLALKESILLTNFSR